MNRSLSIVPVLLALFSTACGYYGRGGYYDNGPGGPSVYQTPQVGSLCDGNAPVDACSQVGLACTPLLVDGGFTCQLPGEFYGCDDSVGCAAGLGCHYGICLEACATTADCWDPLTVCEPYRSAGNQCLLNQCEGAHGFGLWAVCAAANPTGGDGMCVPLDANAGSSGCQQAGTIALGGACQFDRADGGPGFCAVGLICMVDASGDNRGVCLSVCDPFDSTGPNCAAGTSCVASTIPLTPPPVSALEYYSLTGACAQSCTPADDAGTSVPDGGHDGGTDDLDAGMDAGTSGADAGTSDGGCPAPTTCQNGSLSSTADYVCLP